MEINIFFVKNIDITIYAFAKMKGSGWEILNIYSNFVIPL